MSNEEFREPPLAANQRETVADLLRLRRIEGLDSVEAIRRNILRLPNRISELRKRGWVIRQVREANRVMRYFLVSEPDDNSEPDPSGPASPSNGVASPANSQDAKCE